MTPTEHTLACLNSVDTTMATLKLESTDNAVIVQRRETGESERISVTAPIVNLNGATGESLLDQQQEVKRALDKLRTALGAAAPHGRDFQMDSTGMLYAQARKEFERELDFVNEMESRHDEIMARIYNQLHRRG